MRRVAMISEHASPLGALGGVDSGGQNVYVGQLARHLARGGWTVDVFTRRDSVEVADVVEWVDGVRVVHVPAGPVSFLRKEDLLPFMGDFTDWTERFMKRSGPYSVVHANFWMSGLAACDIKRSLGVPFVVTFHALGRVRRLHQRDADDFPDERFAVEDRVIVDADHVIAECPQDERDLIELYKADPARIRIVPCGFDPDELWPIDKPMARSVLGIPAGEKVVLQLGRMVPRKGVDTVVRGFAELLHRHKLTARLLVVGGESEEPDPRITPELGRLGALAEQLDVADRVTFAGSRGRDVLRYYYSAADVFCTMPWYEPFGITPLEAMACGTPVIGSDVGGVKYTVVDGETGYLVPPMDHEALADSLLTLFRNPELARLFGKQAVRRVNDHFTWHKVAEEVAALYEDVLSAEASPRTAIERFATVDECFGVAAKVLKHSQARLRGPLLEAARAIESCLLRGGKVLIAGNGGSAAEAQHMAGELVGRFKSRGRRALAALALGADAAVFTAWSNDVGFDQAFAREVEALGRPGDVLFVLSTSGRSRNLIEAFEAAERNSMRRIALLGGDGGPLLKMADVGIVVPSSDVPRIQEVHLLAVHLLCELVEQRCAEDSRASEAADARAGPGPELEPVTAGAESAT